MTDARGTVLVTGEHVREELLSPIIQAGYEVRLLKNLLSESILTRELEGCVGYVLGGNEYASKTALEAAKQLKVISVLAVGYESFMNVTTARQKGILITNTPGANTNAVAEFTIGHLLNGMRKIGYYAGTYHEKGAGGEETTNELRESCVGLVGLGAIGTRIAEILVQGFNCKVVYYSRTRKPDIEARLGLEYCALHDLIPQIGCLITIPSGNASSINLINEAHIEKLRHPIVLVNTSRPAVISSQALLNGLRNGSIATACYDGFYSDTDANYNELSDRLRM